MAQYLVVYSIELTINDDKLAYFFCFSLKSIALLANGGRINVKTLSCYEVSESGVWQMIGHITYLNPAADYGFLKDFRGQQYRFKLSQVSRQVPLHCGTGVRFEPSVDQSEHFAEEINLIAVAADPVEAHSLNSQSQPDYLRVANIVIPLANVVGFQMTTGTTLIRNGYQTSSRHLTIDLADGRQLNFFNWNEVNIDDLQQRLQKYFHKPLPNK